MELAAKLDDIGKPAWIGLMVLAFIVFWPLGLAVLFYLIWSGRMGCWKNGAGRWHGMERRWRHGRRAEGGNSAFDEYRAETLSRLEDEEREFREFLDRLRQAAEVLSGRLPAAGRPPALMMALHIWALSHGVASLFARADSGRRKLPMSPEELLEAAVLVYLRGLGLEESVNPRN